MKYDGSRGENIGKAKIKDNAKHAIQRKDNLYYDIRREFQKRKLCIIYQLHFIREKVISHPHFMMKQNF